MPRILLLETSTRRCSVAIADGDGLMALRESGGENDHASQVTLFIQDALQDAGLVLQDLDAVALSNGPGSYTGLRIGLSTAKGLCYGLGLPLIAITTLESIAWQIRAIAPAEAEGHLLCPMIDARRMEVYTCLYDPGMGLLKQPESMILGEDSFSDVLASQVILFGGNGAAKAREVLCDHPSARFPECPELSASSLYHPAMQRYQAGEFADLAYAEPFYLKEFMAGVPKVKGLR